MLKKDWILYSPDSDLQTGQDAPVTSGDADAFEEVDVATLPPAAQRYIKQLRAEAADRRKQLATFQSEAQKREQERLIAEGKWKELADARAAELAQLQPYQTRATELEAIIKAQNEARVKQIPEELRSAVPDYAPERLSSWLDANFAKLVRPVAPNLDAGAGVGGVHGTQLTDDQRAIARRMGMTDEQYAKALNKAGG